MNIDTNKILVFKPLLENSYSIKKNDRDVGHVLINKNDGVCLFRVEFEIDGDDKGMRRIANNFEAMTEFFAERGFEIIEVLTREV